MNMLYQDLKTLGNLIHISFMGKKKTTPLSTKSHTKSHSKSRSKSSNKTTRKNTSISFKRESPSRRFKNPILLSIK